MSDFNLNQLVVQQQNRVTPRLFNFGLWTLDFDLDCDNWLCLVFLFTNNEPSIRGHFLFKLNCQKMIHHIWRNSLCQYTVELFIKYIPQTIEQIMNQLIFQSIRNTCWCLYCCENVIKNQSFLFTGTTRAIQNR